jgi:hypothetical protein
MLQHTIRKRVFLWTVGTLLFIAAYFAAAPFVVTTVHMGFQPVAPVVRVIYLPVTVYITDGDMPGSERYTNYHRRCSGWTRRTLSPPPKLAPAQPAF